MYLLTKIIVEKNKKSISLTKVLGFYNKEITKLYIWPVIISIFIFQFITLIIDDHLLKIVWETVRADMSGFLPYSSSILTLIFLYFAGIVLTIGIVFLEYRRIRHIPMDMALKDHN